MLGDWLTPRPLLSEAPPPESLGRWAPAGEWLAMLVWMPVAERWCVRVRGDAALTVRAARRLREWLDQVQPWLDEHEFDPPDELDRQRQVPS